MIYYQQKKKKKKRRKGFTKSFAKDIKIFLKKKKQKSNNMVKKI